MKLSRLVLLLVLPALTDWRSAIAAPAIVKRDVSVESGDRSFRLSLLIFSAQDFQVRVFDNAAGNDKARFQTVAEAMESLGCLAGCNGGFFERKPFAPVGLMISHGQRSGRFDPESWMKGLLVVRGKVATLESTAAFTDTPDITELIQSGPWLVRAGQSETDNSRTQLAKRTFICHDSHGTWAIGASERCSLSELAAALRSAVVTTVLDIQFALNLDGGPSTGLWLRRSEGNYYLPERWPVRNYVGIVPSSSP